MLIERISEPGEADIASLARQLVRARAIVRSVCDLGPTDDIERADLLQRVVDSGFLKADDTDDWQCLGVALGRILVTTLGGLDWVVVEDEYGRDPALRYRQTSILLFPVTMISKRIEDGEDVDVAALIQGIIEHVQDIQRELS